MAPAASQRSANIPKIGLNGPHGPDHDQNSIYMRQFCGLMHDPGVQTVVVDASVLHSILAEGAMTLPVTSSGGVLFAS